MSTRAGSPDGAFWGDVDDDEALHRYRTLVNTIDDGVYQLDSDGHFVAANDVIVETTGYTREELLGEHVSLVLTDADIERIEREIKNQTGTEDEDIATFELGVHTADGDVVPCELRINLLITEGELQGTIGVVRDVSEQKQRLKTLESVQASYDSMTSVLDEANIGVFVLDDEFDVAWADETIERYFGLDRDDLIGFDKRQVVHELVADTVDDPDRFAETVLATYDDNSYTEEFEFHITASDDREERWLEHRSKPIESGEHAGGRIELYYDITDRKRSEDARHETEEQFRSLVDAVEEDAIFRLDAEGHVVSWNDGAKAIKGYDSEEIIGEHFSRFYTEEDRAAGVPERNLERAAEAGSIEDEGWRVRKDGTRFWANVTITAIRDEKGITRGYLKITRDMTDRHEREQELESELQRVFGRVSNAFYAVDEEYRFTHVNERAEQLLEHSEEELLGENIWEMFPTIDRMDDVREAFETAMDSQESTSLEFYNDNLEFWVEADLYPSETGISVYFRDVTDRKGRERELTKYETIVETVNDGIYTVDEDGHFTMVNDAYTELTGYSREELLGSHVSLVVDDETVEQTKELEAEMAAGNVDKPMGEATLRTADGDHVPAEATFSLLPGDETERIGVARDITERKEREQALEESEMRFRMLAENLEETVWIESADTRELLYINPAAETIWGRDREWLYDNPAAFLETVHPDDRQRTEQAYEAVPDEQFDEEYRIVRPDGEIRWLDVQAVPVRNEERQIRRIVGIADDITEHKERERALEESERRYRTLVESFPNGAVGLFDDDLRYTAIGGELVDAVGVSPEDRIGNRVYDIYPDRLAEEVEPYFEAALEGKTNSFEVEFHDRHLFAYTVPVRNDAGEVFAGMLVVQDVTERREFQRQLEEYQRWNQTLIENFPNGAVALVDENLHYITFGGSLEGDADVPREDLEGAPVRDVVPQQIADIIVPRYEAALEGDPSQFEDEIDDRVYQFHFVPVRDDDGDVFAATAISQDITEHKERERALEESERRYRTLVENFPNGAVGLYDEELTYNVVGGELLDGLGFSPDEIVDTTIYGRYPDELVDRIEPNFRAVFEGESNSFDIDLDEHTLLAHTLPVRNADDEIYAGMVVVQDVTELREYQRQLEESNERLEQFAYAASHDLQEPLRMVTSYLQLIENRYGDALDEDGEEFIEFAVDGAERMRQMIDGLLEYSRIETSGDPFEPVDLDDVLGDVREDLQIRIDKSNAEIITDDLPCVDGDDSQLRQVFQNLLSNAIEYSGDEPPQVDISGTRDGEQWIISVQDNGIGIDPDEQERIFEVFQRLHTHEEHSGTGIGLALCRRIVERHGGEIRVESEPGEGSTFSFTLPAVDT